MAVPTAKVHNIRNASTTAPAKALGFQVAPKGTPLQSEEKRMQPRCMAALAVVVGFVAGVVTVHGLHAQAQPPAYVVVSIVDVQQLHDFTKEVVPLAMKALTDQGGKVLAPPDFVGSIAKTGSTDRV